MRVLRRHVDDDAFRVLQLALMRRPEQGAVIRGSGGLRKLRLASASHGKRGGLRLIYYWGKSEQTIYLLYLYAKSDQGDLSAVQIRDLARLVREEFK
jgi:hypothetical protein